MRLILIAFSLCLAAASTLAQGQFTPVITVNNQAITSYELDQRARLLTLFRTPGNPAEVAREQLIDDRLKQELLDRAGLRLTAAALQTEVEAFAARANLPLDQFLGILRQSGVEEETLREFVRMGVSWRDYIRTRFAAQAQITDAELDRELGLVRPTSGGIEILLSEIIIPAPPPRAAQANAIAAQISQMTSQSAFSAAARQYSALPSRTNGGRLGWLPLDNYPPQLRQLLLDLAPGEVSQPIQIPNGVALFQGRGVREGARQPAIATEIEFATFLLPGGRTEAGLRAAQELALRVDTCDDLYGAARGLPAEVLTRDSLPPSQIPQDIALELARLDRDEVSYNLTRAGGQTLVFLMLCDRVLDGDPSAEGTDRTALRNQLRSQRLAGFAEALLEDMRSSAVIRQ